MSLKRSYPEPGDVGRPPGHNVPQSIEASASDLILHSEGKVATPQRGLSFGEIARGTVARFLPSSLLSMGAVIGLLGSFEPIGWFLLWVLSLSGVVALGFGAGLGAMGKWLYRDAQVDGRRSVIAGVLSPLAWAAAILLAEPIGSVAGFSGLALAGFILALAIYFPWLTETTGERPSPLEEGGSHGGELVLEGETD